MKDIDFLPSSYTNSRNMSRTWKRQYSFVVVLVIIVASWLFVTGVNVRRAKAQTEQLSVNNYSLSKASQQYSSLSNSLNRLNKQAQLLSKISSRISFCDLMAEISYVAGDDIVLSSLDVEAEKFGEKKTNSSTVRVVSSKKKKEKVITDEPFRYRVVFHGLARDAAGVAEFIRGLEQSDYFMQVVPGYSRNKTVDEFRFSEFELTCIIANYEEN